MFPGFHVKYFLLESIPFTVPPSPFIMRAFANYVEYDWNLFDKYLIISGFVFKSGLL